MVQSQTRKQKILGDVKKARRRRALISTFIVAIVVIVIVGVVLLLPKSNVDTALIDTPISQTTYNQLTTVSDSTLATVGTGQGAKALTAVSGSLLTFNQKPGVLYVGGDYCPYCGAERWSIIVALSKFGNWTSGSLVYMLSSGTDTPANVPTFSFSSAVYTSNYISFVGVELYHRDGSPFQMATAQETSLMNQYDPGGGIPFVDVGNQYVVNSGSQFLPNVLLSTGNWTQIGSQLNDPNTAVAKSVDGAANYLISTICKIDQNQPASVCGQSYAHVQAPIGPTNMPPANSFNIIASSSILTNDSSWKKSSTA